ncbi:2Fe-2S iron-sulfur cluster binding domain protein [Ostertagia ostertagi]
MYVAARIVRSFTVSRVRRPLLLSRKSTRRQISQTAISYHGDFEYEDPKSEDDVVNITYVLRDGTKKQVRGKVGDNVMYLAHRYGIEMEGACEASLACSTCHCYVDEPYFDRLDEPKEEEEDMLDQVLFFFHLYDPHSRSRCQIILRKDLEGITVTLPPITRNFYVDGHVPQAH